jgi:HEAT repeats
LIDDRRIHFRDRLFERALWRLFSLEPTLNHSMNRNRTGMTIMVALLTVSGCNKEERGPILAGGREVRSWLADLHDRKPTVRRQAVLKLGNVGDADPGVADGLAEALRDTDAVVRRDAVRAAAKLKNPNEAILAQLKVMSESDRDSLARDYAQRAIAHFGKM